MGASQENGRRAGTENVASIVGLGKACKLATEHLPSYSEGVGNLRDRMEKTLQEKITDIRINGSQMPRLANTSNISIKNCTSTSIIQELDERGIAISAHSACHSGDLNPSHVLTAMNIPETFLHGTLRISLSRYNTPEEINTFVDILPGIINKSRQINI